MAEVEMGKYKGLTGDVPVMESPFFNGFRKLAAQSGTLVSDIANTARQSDFTPKQLYSAALVYGRR